MKQNRLFTVLVSLALMLVLLPLSAKADSPTSGTISSTVSWNLNLETGKLTIAGEGYMGSFGLYGSAPWYPHAAEIRSVEIGAGIADIPNFAFYKLINLTSVTIPDGVTEIGTCAFQECASLKTINIPDSVVHMGDAVFYQSGLTSVKLPRNVEGIKAQTFAECKNLVSVTLPEKLGYLNVSAFKDCTALTSVTLPQNLAAIGGNVFAGCTALEKITIPVNVTLVDSGAFDGCTALGQVFFQGDAPLIKESAFSGVSANAYYPRGNATWTQEIRSEGYGGSLSWYSYECEVQRNFRWNLDEATGVLTISGTGDIPSYLVFKGAPWYAQRSKITSLHIEDGITGIGGGAFMDCTRMTEVRIPDSVTSIGDSAFSECVSLGNVTIPDSVTYIGEWAFSGCSSLRSVKLSKNLKELSNYLFMECINLTEIAIPDSVKVIRDAAFGYCSSLTQVTVPDSVTHIGDSVFQLCTGLKSVTLPNNIKWLGESVFADCTSLTDVVIPQSITYLSNALFYNCASLTEVTLPTRAGGTCEYTFAGCTSLTSVTLPQGITEIGYDCFRSCINLTEVTIPDSVTIIRNEAFAKTHNLVKITFPENLQTLEKNVFQNSKKQKDLTFSGSAPTMDPYTFSNLKATIRYPNGYAGWSVAVKQKYHGATLTWATYDKPLADVQMDKAVAHKTGNIIYWKAVSGAKLYQVYRLRSGETTWELLKNTGSLAYKDTTALSGVKYYYKVVARNGSVKSSLNIAGVSATRPYPLDNVNISKGIAHRTGNIVYWSAVDGADLYQVFRRVDGETTWTLLTNTRSLAYKDETAKVGVKYYYKVRARNGSDMSSMSGTAAVLTRPAPLADVKMDKAVGHTTGNIIYWNAVDGAKFYQVYRLRSGETSWELLKNTGSLAYKDTTAQVGVKYYYKVVARDGDLRSSMNIASVSAVRP